MAVNRYNALTEYLSHLNEVVWHASFSQIEAILGFSLPPSARNYPAWWANDPNGSRHSRSWMGVGWKTEEVKLTGGAVTFRKTGKGDRRRSARASVTILPTETQLETPPKSGLPIPKFFDLATVMYELSVARPVFHSEADFQHALAWQIHKQNSALKIRLEYRPPELGRKYLDLWISDGMNAVAIELKYFTRRLDCVHDGEEFSLLQQGAQDISRYDFLKDVRRLEEYTRLRGGTVGAVIAITNDHSFWSEARTDTTVDAAYRLHDGRRLEGGLAWADHTGAGTMKGREIPIELTGSYEVRWQPYSKVVAPRNGEFRSLTLIVN